MPDAAELPSPWTRTLRWLRGQPEPIQSDLARYDAILRDISRCGEPLAGASDEALQRRAAELRDRARASSDLRELVPEGFALVREVSERVIGLRPFDGQLIAGAAMLEGALAQMKTGEGKTLAAALTASLVGWTGRGVHVLTFNDYLAQRDAEWMGPIYRFLGLTVGAVQQDMDAASRRAAYQTDITYATAKEAGFDLLRMQRMRDPSEAVQRGLHFAIVDEADSILIDEARVPLVIAGMSTHSGTEPTVVAAAVGALDAEVHYEVDDKAGTVGLTDAGCDRLEAELDRDDLYAEDNGVLLAEIHQALHAKALLHRDVDYIVRDEQIELVDAFTGRVVDDRRWPDGLQAAVEAKEGLPLRPGGRILGSVTLQHVLERYEVLAGMTATATPAADELQGFYGLSVLVVPEHRPCVREDQPDCVFTHREAKEAALVAELERVHASGRPVLVGTSSVAESERLAVTLWERGIPCEVLNARNHADEAAIVAEAGALGAVTLSTNMAGRGTDIRLGGADERDRDQVVALGGLYVIGTNRHESRRIDDQLRGRAGRQGDPGTSRFFVSLEDDLMVRFRIDRLLGGRLPERQSAPLEDATVRQEIERLQRTVEGQNHDIRRTLWKYASVVNDQATAIGELRDGALHGRLPPLCEVQAPEQWQELVDVLGRGPVQQLEQQVTLHHIDAAWEEHLALTSELRESIHLVRMAGEAPLEAFRKQSLTALWAMEERLDEDIVTTFAGLQVGPDGQVDLAAQGLTPPSATWTYLVDDVGTGTMLGVAGVGNPAAGIGTLMALPLVVVAAWWRRLRDRR